MLTSHLEITDDQHLAIVAYQGEIEKVLAKGFDNYGTVLAGSYSRNTMITVKKSAVIELFLLLRPNYAKQYSSRELVDKLLTILSKHYDKVDISGYGHGVSIFLSEYQFNIVPGVYKENKGYVIPDYKNDKWRRGNPDLYSDQLKTANQQHKGRLLPLIRIIKCWNIANNSVFDEYYLELLVKKILTNVETSTYSKAIEYIFKEATKEIVFSIDDPARFEIQVQGLADVEKLAEAMIAFHTAYKKTLKAKEYEHEGKLDLSYNEWESIFPGVFPKPFEMLAKELEGSGVEGAKALKIMMDRTH